MKYIFTFLLLLVLLRVDAQVSHTPNPLVMTAPVDSFDTKITFYFESPAIDSVYWRLTKDASTWNDVWETQVCDLNLCYLENRDFSSPSLPNAFVDGKNKFEFHFRPNKKAGCTVVKLTLYRDPNFTDVIYSVDIDVNNCKPSSTLDGIEDYLSTKVYPNPAEDYFQIASNKDVEKVVLYNMFGKEVKSFYHYNLAKHEISQLKSGMYIVKLLDAKNKLIKTIKLSKITNGA